MATHWNNTLPSLKENTENTTCAREWFEEDDTFSQCVVDDEFLPSDSEASNSRGDRGGLANNVVACGDDDHDDAPSCHDQFHHHHSNSNNTNCSAHPRANACCNPSLPAPELPSLVESVLSLAHCPVPLHNALANLAPLPQQQATKKRGLDAVQKKAKKTKKSKQPNPGAGPASNAWHFVNEQHKFCSASAPPPLPTVDFTQYRQATANGREATADETLDILRQVSAAHTLGEVEEAPGVFGILRQVGNEAEPRYIAAKLQRWTSKAGQLMPGNFLAVVCIGKSKRIAEWPESGQYVCDNEFCHSHVPGKRNQGKRGTKRVFHFCLDAVRSFCTKCAEKHGRCIVCTREEDDSSF